MHYKYGRWVGVAAIAGASVLIGSSASAAPGWTAETVPQTGNNILLLGAAARTSTDAWAVGEQFAGAGQAPPPPVSYRWNGTAWSLVATPTLGVSSALLAVSASAATDAWAVGFSILGRHNDGTLIEHWNGSAWSVNSSRVVTGFVAQLNGVADLSPTDAWAVGKGGGSTLIEHWNGASWSIVPSPTPGGDPSLAGVAARGAADVYAVGNNLPSVNGGVVQGLILRWNGSAWSQDTDPTDGS